MPTFPNRLLCMLAKELKLPPAADTHDSPEHQLALPLIPYYLRMRNSELWQLRKQLCHPAASGASVGESWDFLTCGMNIAGV